MNKKKMIITLFTSLLLMPLLIPVKGILAEETTDLVLGGQLEDSSEYAEIQGLLEKNYLFPYAEDNFLQEDIRITPEELDSIALKPYKMYFSSSKDSIDFFNPGTKDKKELLQLMDQEGYDWEFPFKKDNLYVIVSIHKQTPLTPYARARMTPEDMKSHALEVGKWLFGGSLYTKKEYDYRKIIEEVMAEKPDIKDYVIVAAGNADFGIVALGFDETQVKYMIPLHPMDQDSIPFGLDQIVPKELAIPLASGRVIYNYDEVAPYGTMIWENSKRYVEEHGFTMGGVPGLDELAQKLEAEKKGKTMAKIWIGLGSVVVLIGVVGAYAALKHKKRA